MEIHSNQGNRPFWTLGGDVYAHLLLSGTLVHRGTLADIRQLYGVTLLPDVVMVLSIDRYPDLMEQHAEVWPLEVGQQVERQLKSLMTALDLDYLSLWTEAGVLAVLIDTADVLRPGVDQVEPETAGLLRLAKKIQAGMNDVHVSMSIGVGKPKRSLLDVCISHQEAMHSLRGRFFQGNQLIFLYRDDVPKPDPISQHLTVESTELFALMQIDEKQGVLAQLEQVLSQMARDAAYQEEVFKSQVVDLLMRMSRFAIDRGANASDVLTQNALVIHDLYETIRYDKFVLKVSHYASWLVAQAGSCHWPEVSTVAKQALTFLHRHHHQSVTLDDVANWCCVSKYHLGHMFKEEVGVSIIDYLNQIRIDKAKYYLESSDLPIQQISNSVGFQDANYFSRTFRKVTGQSPRAYRKARLC